MTPQELEECKAVFLAGMFEQPPEPLAQWAQKYGFKLIEHIEKLEGELCIEMAVGQQQLDEILNENAALKRAAEAQGPSAPSDATPGEEVKYWHKESSEFRPPMSVGLLGATVPLGTPFESQLSARLYLAETHILKLEATVQQLIEDITPKPPAIQTKGPWT